VDELFQCEGLSLLVDGPLISFKLRNNGYENDRNPGVATISDTSRLRIGRQSLINRLQCLQRVKFKWTNGINKHALRMNLKKTFMQEGFWKFKLNKDQFLSAT